FRPPSIDGGETGHFFLGNGCVTGSAFVQFTVQVGQKSRVRNVHCIVGGSGYGLVPRCYRKQRNEQNQSNGQSKVPLCFHNLSHKAPKKESYGLSFPQSDAVRLLPHIILLQENDVNTLQVISTIQMKLKLRRLGFMLANPLPAFQILLGVLGVGQAVNFPGGGIHQFGDAASAQGEHRSEERRVGKERRGSGWGRGVRRTGTERWYTDEVGLDE